MDWLIVLWQLYFTINLEEIFYFCNKNINIKNDLENDGTYREYGIAKDHKKNIIPVGVTGWTSKYIYEETSYEKSTIN